MIPVQPRGTACWIREGGAPCGQVAVTQTLKNEAEPILGGVNMTNLEVPWHVTIHFKKSYLCGGTILDKWWILTASHCFRNDNASGFKVHLATTDIHSQQVEKRTVKMIILHPNFNQLFMDNDIALLLLNDPIEFGTDKIPICVTKDIKNMKECWVSGWGSSRPKRKTSSSLQKANLQLLNWEECYKKVFMLTENMLCAWDVEGKRDSCQGDSGGPLVCHQGTKKKIWYQVGIVSWGEGCGRKGKPGIYTAVSNYLLWIVLQTRKAGYPYILDAGYFFAPSRCLVLTLYFLSLFYLYNYII
ncbi:serine protease 55 isoform X2 [Monodelphis domestica]|uniref:Serine protease 55 n=1 Tax=Monodelphis domestica TaxID=13616 RepID=A0A5F8H3G8_MONDO|nr:serine protease 55 isoform X2 [Monodelphis domestica]